MTIRKKLIAALIAAIVAFGALAGEAAAKDIPVQKGFDCTVGGSSATNTVTYAVPKGKRLVIEFASVICKLSGTSRVLGALPLASIKTQNGSETVETYVQLTPSGTVHYEDAQPSDNCYFMGDRRILLFADPSTTVTVTFFINGSFYPEGGDLADCQAVISGYLQKP